MTADNTIKIFLDAHIFDGEFQGSRTFVLELYNILLQKKELCFYIGAHDVDNLKKYFPVAENIVFVKLKNRSSVLRLLIDIPKIIKKYGIQYAHFQYIVPPIKNCKFIVTTHDVLFNDYPKEFSFWYRLSKNFLYKFAAKRADILTTDSLYSKKSIQKYLGIVPEKINIIRLGINNKYFEPYDIQLAKNTIKEKYGLDKYILFVSRLEPRKNHTMLLQAYLDLKLFEQNYSLVFIGYESIKAPAFYTLLNALPLHIKSYIVFSDKTNDEELMDFYKAATVFVYPSKAEGFGLPPLEAGALKIPVLCSNTTSLSDFTFFDKMHIDPNDYGLFKNTLAEVLINKPSEKQLASISKTIQQNYCWQNTAAQFYQLLQENNTQ